MIAEEKKIWKIREQLEDLTEENYKQFNEKLLPGVKHIIGVRLPALRKIAKETAKSNYSEYLNEAGTMLGEASYHEEFMVWGLVIAYIKADRSEVERHLDEFVPKINNWAVCDSCVTSYKFMQLVHDANLRQSMSRRGNCWDNAPQESFYGHMKDEIHISKCKDFEALRAEIDRWMDYYNNDRYQWKLAKLSPNEYYEYVKTGLYPLRIF